jgi:predicted peptidase
MKTTLIALSCILFSHLSYGEPLPELKLGQHAYHSEAANLDYLAYAPKGYTETKEKWPLILFLHGAGERGNDLNMLKRAGPPMLVGRIAMPFVVVSPQCPHNRWWPEKQFLKSLETLIDQLINDYSIDPDRIYLTGLSMGGYGTWSLAAHCPKKFAAIAPICGGGKPKTAKRILKIPTWVFHGARDQVVPIDGSQKMVDALKAIGSNVKFTVYPRAGHDSWTATYRNPELYKWFLAHSR